MTGVLAMVALVQLGGRSELAIPSSADRGEPHFCPSENPADATAGDDCKLA
jgi:hypothetical protein